MKNPRKRGAQPGNTNALKHGFYSRIFRKQEHEDLDQFLTNGIEAEIDLMRIVTRRVFEMTDEMKDLNQATRALCALVKAATTLAKLLRTQELLGGGAEESTGTIYRAPTLSQALLQVNEDWKTGRRNDDDAKRDARAKPGCTEDESATVGSDKNSLPDCE